MTRLRAAPSARKRAGGVVRLGGVAGALLQVKKEEDVSGARRPVRIRKAAQEPAAAAARLLAAPERSKGGFGYGEGDGDESEESAQEPAENSRPPRNIELLGRPQRSLLPAPTKAPETRNRNLMGTMLGHLNSAKRQLTQQRTGIRVKEEAQEREPQARWKPDASPARESEDAASEEDAEPPRKRAKREETKLSNKERERQLEKEAEDHAKAEAKEMQNLQRRLEDHYSSMKNFIRTRAEPTIFYLPAKHNDESKRELKETRSAIGQKIASLKVHLQSTAASNDEDEEDDGVSN